MSQPRLPANFAARLCLKETELSDHCSFQVITELVGLYQQAIEYFEAKRDPREAEFQRKLQEMLVRTEVVEQLDAVQHQSGRRESRTVRVSSPVKSVPKPSNSSPKSHVPVPETLISHHSSNTTNVVEATRNDIKQQISDLQIRLKHRKSHNKTDWKTHLSDTRIPTGETEITDSSIDDIGEFFGDASADVELLEAEFDTVMERCYQEKQQRMVEVREKYTAQLDELETEISASGGNQLLEQVATRLRQDMEVELMQTSAAANAERKEQLKTLKGKFWNAH
jgi:hypothetical protein